LEYLEYTIGRIGTTESVQALLVWQSVYHWLRSPLRQNNNSKFIEPKIKFKKD